tara:strand:+ start:240 stop:377 length:138 start_codon:yes stop_codon:yes gene_type:complete
VRVFSPLWLFGQKFEKKEKEKEKERPICQTKKQGTRKDTKEGKAL